MSKNFYLTLISLSILLAIIVIPSIIKVNNRHNEKLIRVVESKIKQKALDCFYEEDCSEEITLKELYDKKYLEKMANPISKEYYNNKSYVLIQENIVEFIEVKN